MYSTPLGRCMMRRGVSIRIMKGTSRTSSHLLASSWFSDPSSVGVRRRNCSSRGIHTDATHSTDDTLSNSGDYVSLDMMNRSVSGVAAPSNAKPTHIHGNYYTSLIDQFRVMCATGSVASTGDRWQHALDLFLSETDNKVSGNGDGENTPLTGGDAGLVMEWMLYECTAPASTCPSETASAIYDMCRTYSSIATGKNADGGNDGEGAPIPARGSCQPKGIHYRYARYLLSQVMKTQSEESMRLHSLDRFFRVLLLDTVADGVRSRPASLMLLLEGLRQFHMLPGKTNTEDGAYPVLHWLHTTHCSIDIARSCMHQLRSFPSLPHEAQLLYWGILQRDSALDKSFVAATAQLGRKLSLPQEAPVKGTTGMAAAEQDAEAARFHEWIATPQVEGCLPVFLYQACEWIAGGATAQQALFREATNASFWRSVDSLLSLCMDSSDRQKVYAAALVGPLTIQIESQSGAADTLWRQRCSLAAWLVYRSMLELRRARNSQISGVWVAQTEKVVSFIQTLFLAISPSLRGTTGKGPTTSIEQDVWSIILTEACRGSFASDVTGKNTTPLAPRYDEKPSASSCFVLQHCVFQLYGPRLWQKPTINLYINLLHQWNHSTDIRRAFSTIQRREEGVQNLVWAYVRHGQTQQEQEGGEGHHSTTPTDDDAEIAMQKRAARYRPALSLHSCEIVLEHCITLKDPHTAAAVMKYMLLSVHAQSAADTEKSYNDAMPADANVVHSSTDRSRESWLAHIKGELLPKVRALEEQGSDHGNEN